MIKDNIINFIKIINLKTAKIKEYIIIIKLMKITELCKMIEDSIRSNKYYFENEKQKYFSQFIEITNKSETDDLKSNNIIIETRIRNFYTINNYIQNIQHLPGVIEIDIIDSFKMLCRRLERLEENANENNNKKYITLSKSTKKISNS
jgi:hypothetical protein